MSIIDMNSGAELDEFLTAPDIEETVEQLRSRRSTIALLEAECAAREETTAEPIWRRGLLPGAWVSITFATMTVLPGPTNASSLVASMALAWVAVNACLQLSVRAQAFFSRSAVAAGSDLPRLGTNAILLVGMAALSSALDAGLATIVLFGIGSALINGHVWFSPKPDNADDPRPALVKAKRELADQEAAFENNVSQARTTLDFQIEQARQAAGVSAVAAE